MTTHIKETKEALCGGKRDFVYTQDSLYYTWFTETNVYNVNNVQREQFRLNMKASVGELVAGRRSDTGEMLTTEQQQKLQTDATHT